MSDDKVTIKPGAPIEVPTKQGPFTVVLSKFKTREVQAPDGYKLPKKLMADWTTLADAIRAVRRWDNTEERLVEVENKPSIPRKTHLLLADNMLETKNLLVSCLNKKYINSKVKTKLRRFCREIDNARSALDEVYVNEIDTDYKNSPYYSLNKDGGVCGL
jgi:hypothetical protein